MAKSSGLVNLNPPFLLLVTAVRYPAIMYASCMLVVFKNYTDVKLEKV